MDSVKSYVLCALLAAAASGIVKMLSSGIKGFEKYVGLIASLVMILVLAKPLSGVIIVVMNEISSIASDYECIQKDPQESEKTEHIASDHAKGALEETIKDILCRNFEIDRSDIKVSAVFADDMSVEKVVIRLSSNSISSEVESYVEKSLLISAEIESETME